MLNQSLLPELKYEAASTRRMLERVPFDKWSWKPHEKSMSLGELATHVADLVNWSAFTLETTEINWAEFKYNPPRPSNSEELLAIHDKNTAASVRALEGATDEQLMAPWTMRAGDQVYFTLPRIATIRTYAFNHVVHHRGQLSVYLRLLGVPVPGMYGPTADEQG
ncbi:DinB family protein [Flaviaesturariibacter amylovorans]|uniref:DinB family protein n=1 Tax=Flaviaesturariibacter amylovorans TaxID=1084520 RepID=A0ABP8GSJ2_9BACT